MISQAKIRTLMRRFLVREPDELAIIGIARGESLAGYETDVTVEEIPTPIQFMSTTEPDRQIGTVESVNPDGSFIMRVSGEFDRRQALRATLRTVFEYSVGLIPIEEAVSVQELRELIASTGNCDSIHNGNKSTLKWLLKTHPISHVENMRLDEMKVVAVALAERDEVTIQTIVDTARRRRNG